MNTVSRSRPKGSKRSTRGGFKGSHSLSWALATLHKHERIKEVSLPGMAYRATDGDLVRAVDGFDSLEDGMVEEHFGPIPDSAWDGDGWRFHAPDPVAEDPCTAGGLLALLSEATAGRFCLSQGSMADGTVILWNVGLYGDLLDPPHIAEFLGTAVASALIALAAGAR